MDHIRVVLRENERNSGMLMLGSGAQGLGGKYFALKPGTYSLIGVLSCARSPPFA